MNIEIENEFHKIKLWQIDSKYLISILFLWNALLTALVIAMMANWPQNSYTP